MDQLTLILNTLNRVSVSGRENLTRLLGCIQALERLQSPDAPEEADAP